MAVKAKSRRAAGGMADILTTVPAPVTAADRIVLEIRKFIASAIFFNTQAAEKIGLSLTDMQMLHLLQLYGPATPTRLAAWRPASRKSRRPQKPCGGRGRLRRPHGG